MKPQLLKIHRQPEHSFNVRHDAVPYFYNKLHYHSEIELVFIIKGTGQRFIGDDIHYFKGGDMVLVGENLPHLWRSDEKYLSEIGVSKCEALVIHFTKDCFGKDFFYLPENKNLLELLNKAKLGIGVKNHTKGQVINLMREMLHASSTKSIILLLKILDLIAVSNHTETICRHTAQLDFQPADSEKINKVYQYIIQNFDREISLKEIASLVHLTPNSFCRYFKSRTKKSFSKFLIEIRIGHACKLLAETEKPVAEICYECGYNNFSNFNKIFKIVTSRTPVHYRSRYQDLEVFSVNS